MVVEKLPIAHIVDKINWKALSKLTFYQSFYNSYIEQNITKIIISF
jgi:hypothetical protein